LKCSSLVAYSAVRKNEFSGLIKVIEQLLVDVGIKSSSAELIYYNINAIVKADYDSIPVCIKLYRDGGRKSSRRVTSITGETHALISLYRDAISVPQLININQNFVVGTECFSGYMYRFAETLPLNPAKTEEFHLLTLNLARIHTCKESHLDLGRFSMLNNGISDSSKAVEVYFPVERTFAEQWAVDLLNTWEIEISRGLSVLQNVDPADLVLSIVHGRIKPEHVHCVGDDKILILDWETICISERIMELAYVLSHLCLMGETELLDEHIMKSILDEYIKLIPMNKTERSILKKFFHWECYWVLFTDYHEHRLASDASAHRNRFIQLTQLLGSYQYDLFD
jgi:hypothetical protein